MIGKCFGVAESAPLQRNNPSAAATAYPGQRPDGELWPAGRRLLHATSFDRAVAQNDGLRGYSTSECMIRRVTRSDYVDRVADLTL
jgi:hypothetical protein